MANASRVGDPRYGYYHRDDGWIEFPDDYVPPTAEEQAANAALQDAAYARYMASIAGKPVSTLEDIENSRQKYAKEQAELPLKALMTELGGENPQNRAIAEGLQKQGIASANDIGVRKVEMYHAGYEGNDQVTGYAPYTTIENEYFNKATGQKINPNRLGIYQVDKDGKAQGDIFFHLNADDQGNVKFEPEWSPRAHGFLRDNPIGQLIMKAGAVIPNPFQMAFVAANVGDALAHEKYGKALLAAAPYAFQQLGGMDAVKGALGLSGPSGLDMGEVIPQGGIAEFAPDQIEQLLNNRLNYPDVSFDNPMSAPNAPVGNAATSAVDRIPFIKSTNLVNGVVDGSPLDVSLADQTFQKIINPLDTGVPIDSMTARSIADSFYNPNGQLTNAAGQSGNLTLDDIIAGKGTSIKDVVGSDFSGGTPTDGMLGTPPADVVNGSKVLLQNGSLTDPNSLTTNNVVDTNTKLDTLDKVVDTKNTRVDAAGNSKLDLTGTKLDLNGNTITDTLTLDKALDLGKAYLDDPLKLAGLVGTGLAATGLVNNVIGGNKVVDTKATDSDAALTSKQIPSMVTVGSTPGLQDLFNYADLYKSSVFAPYVQQQAQPTAQIPSFTVSDVFRNLMADAAPQPKIEPTLVGLADLQKKMMVGK
jgi:hypothetical protein